MRNIRIGIIGWGFMGRTHAHAVRSIGLFYPNAGFTAQITAVCSRKLDDARAAADELGAGFYTDDYHTLLARSDVDAVSICTPNALHEEIAIAAMRAGKHVYIDKPLTTDAQSAARVADVAAETGVITQMVFNNRYLPCALRAKQLIEEGRIGRIMTFAGRYLHSGSIDPSKPAGWKMGPQGGVLLDLGSHVLDLITWLIGYPAQVFGAERTLYSERPARGGGAETAPSEDHVLVNMRMADGALGFVEAGKISTGANDELTIEIRGDKGALMWDLMQPNYLMFYDNTLPEVPLGGDRGFTRIETVARYPAPGGIFLPPKNAVGWDRGHLHCYYEFLKCVNNETASRNPVSEGARLQALMDKIKLSAAENRWVDTRDI